MKPVKSTNLEYERNIALAPYNTLGLGGSATYFYQAKTITGLQKALSTAHDKKLPLLVLGGGSNVVLPDAGFDGLVIQIALRGITFFEPKITKNIAQKVAIEVAAGENWDDFVVATIERGLSGLECLSGIPGLVGGTPIQNVGAYGREVAPYIHSVRCLDRKTGKLENIAARECKFAYRNSIFKIQARNHFVIISVRYELPLLTTQATDFSQIAYPELRKHIKTKGTNIVQTTPSQYLHSIRQAVLELRRKKSMVVDPQDPHSRSAGSFFTNPIITTAQHRILEERCQGQGIKGRIPCFPLETSTGGRSNKHLKVSAAWLIEQAGFPRGLRKGGVGISANHSLALVNYGGTTRELLALAKSIQDKVAGKFQIELVPEPILA